MDKLITSAQTASPGVAWRRISMGSNSISRINGQPVTVDLFPCHAATSSQDSLKDPYKKKLTRLTGSPIRPTNGFKRFSGILAARLGGRRSTVPNFSFSYDRLDVNSYQSLLIPTPSSPPSSPPSSSHTHTHTHTHTHAHTSRIAQDWPGEPLSTLDQRRVIDAGTH